MPTLSFRHPFHTKSKVKMWVERERKKESGLSRSMVDSEGRYSTEKKDSVQSREISSTGSDQFHGFRSVKVLKFDTPPEGSKNYPEVEGGSVRVQISLSRPVSFFMMKPRLCLIRDQLSPVQSSRLLGFG
ncbi:hypothetical protein YC2023_052838 [Brassica napus]